MKKITIEYDDADDLFKTLVCARQVLLDNTRHLNLSKNVKIVFDKQYESGLVTQQGKYIPFMARRTK